MAECYASTTANAATALGFFSMICSLQSLEMLEFEQNLVTALSVDSWPGVLQMIQKHIRGWKIGLEVEMFSCKRGLESNHECEVSGRISHGQPVRKPLSTTHGDGGSILSEGVNRQGFLGVQVCTIGTKVAPLSQVVAEDTRSSAARSKRGLE